MAVYSVTVSPADDQRITKAFGSILGSPGPVTTFEVEQQIALFLSNATQGQESQVIINNATQAVPPLVITPVDPKPI